MRKRLTKSDVIKAACTLADVNPTVCLTLKGLAESLGIKSPSLYNHAASLEDLKREIAIHTLSELHMFLMQSLIGCAKDKALRNAATAMRDFAKKHPITFHLAQTAPAPNDSQWSDAATKIIEVLYLVFSGHDLSPSQIVHAVRSFRSMIYGFTTLEREEGFKMNVDVEESFAYMISLFVLNAERSNL